MKKIAQFIIMSVTSAISILALFVILFRIDLVIDLFNTKPILLLIGLTIGATVGFLVGTLATYNKLNTELTNKKLEVKKLQKDLRKAEGFIEKILPDALTAKNIQAAKFAEEAKNQSAKRTKQIFGEIDDLSEKTITTEVIAATAEDELDVQDEVADET